MYWQKLFVTFQNFKYNRDILHLLYDIFPTEVIPIILVKGVCLPVGGWYLNSIFVCVFLNTGIYHRNDAVSLLKAASYPPGKIVFRHKLVCDLIIIHFNWVILL